MGYAQNKLKESDMDVVLNVLALAALAGVGGIIFVSVCISLIRAFDILENDHHDD